MPDLEAAISLIERQTATPTARCVIVDQGFPPESVLLGTRDSFLRLAKAILESVLDADVRRLPDAGDAAVDDRIKSVMHSLPTLSAFIVSCYLFPNHETFVAELSKIVDPQIRGALTDDPQFAK
jgi:hypothetical protein